MEEVAVWEATLEAPVPFTAGRIVGVEMRFVGASGPNEVEASGVRRGKGGHCQRQEVEPTSGCDGIECRQRGSAACRGRGGRDCLVNKGIDC